MKRETWQALMLPSAKWLKGIDNYYYYQKEVLKEIDKADWIRGSEGWKLKVVPKGGFLDAGEGLYIALVA